MEYLREQRTGSQDIGVGDVIPVRSVSSLDILFGWKGEAMPENTCAKIHRPSGGNDIGLEGGNIVAQ